MDTNLYNQLISQIKKLENKTISLPPFGEQDKYSLFNRDNKKEKYFLVVNRKGHRNKDNLTLLINSQVYKETLIRFDINGSDHFNYEDNHNIPTPHLHIFNEEYSNGQLAIPLHNVYDKQLIDELMDGLEFFMDYSNIMRDNVVIEPTLI